jgi:Flp pilus assembly pilin Flp
MKLFKRLVTEDDGMEMIEWAIVGVVFAIAGAVAWGGLATSVNAAITGIAGSVTAPPAVP